MLCDEFLSFAHLIFTKLGGIFEVHLLFPQRCVASGQSQTTQRVASSPPLLDNAHDVVFDGPSQRNTCGAHTDVCAAVNDTLWSTLSM